MAELFEMWTATLVHDTNKLPFSNSSSLYKKIDATPLGDVAWENFTVSYDGPRRPENPDDVPSWMKVPYETWYRDPRKLINNMIGNPDFDGEFDTTPFHEYDADHKHRFQNFMSGDWAWEQAVSFLVFNGGCHGAENICRTLLLMTLPRVVQCLFPSFWEVTRQLSPLQLDIINTGRFICPLETFTIPHVELDEMVLFFFVFFPYQRVRHTFPLKEPVIYCVVCS